MFQEKYVKIEKISFDTDERIITWKIPKDLIGNPKPGDVLPNTWFNVFQMFEFIGRMVFIRPFLVSLINIITGKHVGDISPEEGIDENYTFQY